jgi:hypothetical protein
VLRGNASQDQIGQVLQCHAQRQRQPIKVIKGAAYKFESHKNIYLALDNAKCTFYAYLQAPDETNANFMSKFKNTIEVIKHYGGAIGKDKALLLEELKLAGHDADTAATKEILIAKDKAKCKAHAIAFLKQSNKGRYGLLIMELKNQFTRGTNQYPTSITETYNLLVKYKKLAVNRDRTPRTPRGNRGNQNAGAPQDELAFVQQQTEPPIEAIQCFNCQQMSLYASSCSSARVPPDTNRDTNTGGIQLLQCAIKETKIEEDKDDSDVHFSFHMNDTITHTPAHMINPNWILLDSKSTVSIFSNKKFLPNVRHCGTKQALRVHSNGGFQDTHMIRDLPGFGPPVWYKKGSLANILSIAAIRKICRVTMDTLAEATIIVHKHNGNQMKFLESKTGLYYYNAQISTKSKSTNYSFCTLSP